MKSPVNFTSLVPDGDIVKDHLKKEKKIKYKLVIIFFIMFYYIIPVKPGASAITARPTPK